MAGKFRGGSRGSPVLCVGTPPKPAVRCRDRWSASDFQLSQNSKKRTHTDKDGRIRVARVSAKKKSGRLSGRSITIGRSSSSHFDWSLLRDHSHLRDSPSNPARSEQSSSLSVRSHSRLSPALCDDDPLQRDESKSERPEPRPFPDIAASQRKQGNKEWQRLLSLSDELATSLIVAAELDEIEAEGSEITELDLYSAAMNRADEPPPSISRKFADASSAVSSAMRFDDSSILIAHDQPAYQYPLIPQIVPSAASSSSNSSHCSAASDPAYSRCSSLIHSAESYEKAVQKLTKSLSESVLRRNESSMSLNDSFADWSSQYAPSLASDSVAVSEFTDEGVPSLGFRETSSDSDSECSRQSCDCHSSRNVGGSMDSTRPSSSSDDTRSEGMTKAEKRRLERSGSLSCRSAAGSSAASSPRHHHSHHRHSSKHHHRRRRRRSFEGQPSYAAVLAAQAAQQSTSKSRGCLLIGKQRRKPKKRRNRNGRVNQHRHSRQSDAMGSGVQRRAEDWVVSKTAMMSPVRSQSVSSLLVNRQSLQQKKKKNDHSRLKRASRKERVEFRINPVTSGMGECLVRRVSNDNDRDDHDGPPPLKSSSVSPPPSRMTRMDELWAPMKQRQSAADPSDHCVNWPIQTPRFPSDPAHRDNG